MSYSAVDAFFKRYKRRDWLKEKYITEDLSLADIGEMCGVIDSSVRRYVKKFKLCKGSNGSPGHKVSERTQQKLSEAWQRSKRKNKYGNESANWRGDAAGPDAGRARARKLFKVEKCETCGTKAGKLNRHHVDQNPLNNRKENIKILCCWCHARLHARLKQHSLAK